MYFYTTALDPTAEDFLNDSRVSVVVSEAQMTGKDASHCVERDEEDPTCAKVVISGRMKRVPESGLPFARKAMFSRHPVMEST